MSLLDRAKHALIWNAGFNVLRDILALIVMLVLVRILDPEQYGQFALVTATIGFISVFAHQNFIAHTLQVRDDGEVNYQDHFTAGCVIQFSMFVITNFAALAMSYFDRFASISPLVSVMSIGFLLEWPCELRLKMLERSLDWRRLRILHAIGLVISSIAAIAMAVMGAGVYALLLPGLLVTVPFIADLFLLQKWRPTWSWSRDRYMPALRFGFLRMTSGLVGRSRKLIESGVVVYVLGFASAGLLERAVSLGAMLCQRAASQVMYTLYPVITKLDPDTESYRRASSILLRGITWFAVPSAVVLAVLAAPVVHVVYGGNWEEVVPLVPVAVFLGASAAIFHVVYLLLLGHNEERRCVKTDIFEMIGTFVVLFLLLPKGLTEYLIGLLVIRLMVLACSLYWLLSCRAVKRKDLSDALFPAMLSSGMAYAVCGAVIGAMGWSLGSVATMLTYLGLFSIAYLSCLRIIFPQLLKELVGYLPGNGVVGRFLFVSREAV